MSEFLFEDDDEELNERNRRCPKCNSAIVCPSCYEDYRIEDTKEGGRCPNCDSFLVCALCDCGLVRAPSFEADYLEEEELDEKIEGVACELWESLNDGLDKTRWKERHGFESCPMEITVDCDMRVLQFIRKQLDDAILKIKEWKTKHG